MTEEELQESHYMLQTLNDPRFAKMVSTLLEENSRQWAVAQTTEERETLWHEQKAMTGLVVRMQSYADRIKFEQRKADLRDKQK